MKQQEIKQQQHYDTISVLYDTHYNDLSYTSVAEVDLFTTFYCN